MFSLILQSIQISLQSMRANKLRTGLTTLGIIIGIASVIIVFSAGEGIRGLIMGQVEGYGTDILQTEVKVPTSKKGTAGDAQSGAALAQGVQVTTLKIKDMMDMRKLPNIKTNYAAVLSQTQVSYANEMRKAFLFGVSSTYLDIDKSTVEYGRFFTEEEDKGLAQVVVIGPKMKDKLFGESDALGKMIKLHNSKFTVVGVMKARGATMGLDFDDYVYVPVQTLQKRIMGIDHVLYILSQLKDNSKAAAYDTAEEIRVLLRENHNIDNPDKDDFRVTTMDEMMTMLNTITNAITYLLLAIVIISLVVGGVGIMNVMYVVVTERISEIGLRKAVGARFADIMWQFLTESVIVTILGGIVGILVGIGLSFLIAAGASRAGLTWEFVVPLKGFVVAIVFSLVFGVAFGLYPARKAAKLDPIEALRSE